MVGYISQTLDHFLSQIVQLQITYIGKAHIKEICSTSTLSHWVDDCTVDSGQKKIDTRALPVT